MWPSSPLPISFFLASYKLKVAGRGRPGNEATPEAMTTPLTYGLASSVQILELCVGTLVSSDMLQINDIHGHVIN